MVGHRAAPTGMVLAAAAAGYGWNPCCSYWSGCSCYCRVWLATLLPRHDFNVTGFPRRDFNVTGCSRHDFNVLLLLLPGMVGHRAAATGMFLAAAAAGYGWTPCCSYWSGCSCYCRVRLATLLPRQDFNVTGFWRHDFNVRVDSRVTFRVTIPDGSKNQNAIVWACDFPFELVKIWRDAREQYFTNRDVKYYIFFVARDLRIPWCPLRCSVLGELCLRSSLLS
jgi:hypothetical protein